MSSHWPEVHFKSRWPIFLGWRSVQEGQVFLFNRVTSCFISATLGPIHDNRMTDQWALACLPHPHLAGEPMGCKQTHESSFLGHMCCIFPNPAMFVCQFVCFVLIICNYVSLFWVNIFMVRITFLTCLSWPFVQRLYFIYVSAKKKMKEKIQIKVLRTPYYHEPSIPNFCTQCLVSTGSI